MFFLCRVPERARFIATRSPPLYSPIRVVSCESAAPSQWWNRQIEGLFLLLLRLKSPKIQFGRVLLDCESSLTRGHWAAGAAVNDCRVAVMIMAPCGMEFESEVLGAKQEQHLTINNLLLFSPCVCVYVCFSFCVCCFYVFWSSPRSIMVSLYGSSPQVKRLVQTALAAVAAAPSAALSSSFVTHSWPGQMVSTQVAIYRTSGVVSVFDEPPCVAFYPWKEEQSILLW